MGGLMRNEDFYGSGHIHVGTGTLTSYLFNSIVNNCIILKIIIIHNSINKITRILVYQELL